MAKKTSSKADYKGYVPFIVDKALKTKVSKVNNTTAEALEWLTALVDDGCKVSITFEDERQCYFIQAFQQEIKHVNSGLILSTRHVDLRTAVNLLLTLHNDVFSGEWANPDKQADQYNW